MADQICSTCLFFQVDYYQQAEFGGCRRYPPQIEKFTGGATRAEQYTARFPSVRPTDWCGEWRNVPGPT